MTNVNVKRMIRGRRVVIIGPATSCAEWNTAKDIEDYDIIVRLNQGMLVPEEWKSSIGTRTDILFTHLLTYNQFLRHDIESLKKVKRVVITNNKQEQGGAERGRIFKEHLDELGIRSEKPSDRRYKQLRRKHKSIYPTTGLLALHYLLDSDLKELYVTGLTFYKPDKDGRSAHPNYYPRMMPDGIEQGITLHPFDTELRSFVRRIMDKRVTVDPTLGKMIEDFKNK